MDTSLQHGGRLTGRISRSKRIIVLTGLYLKLLGESPRNKTTLERLNGTLHLVRDVRALEFPANLMDMIWKNAVVQKARAILSTGKIEEACRLLVDSLPRWIRYGNTDDVLMADVRQVSVALITNYHLA